MLDKVKTVIKRLFTDERFPSRSDDLDGGKRIGEVYDIDYMPDPEDPGHMMMVFSRKDEE